MQYNPRVPELPIFGDLADALLSLLPPRWRPAAERGRELPHATAFSAIILWIASSAALAASYLHLAFLRGGVLPGASEPGGAQAIPLGLVAEFFLQPTTLPLIYLWADSSVRTVAGITGEDRPLLVLGLIDFLHRRVRRARALRELGPLVPDNIFRGDGTQFDLRIESCRPKDWGPLVALSHQDEFFHVTGMDIGPPPRRFLYFLRKLPPGTVARGLRAYDPKEAVKAGR